MAPSAPPTPSSDMVPKIHCLTHGPSCRILSCHLVAAIQEGMNQLPPHSTSRRRRRPKRALKASETSEEASLSEKQPRSIAREVQFPGVEGGGTAANTESETPEEQQNRELLDHIQEHGSTTPHAREAPASGRNAKPVENDNGEKRIGE